MDWKDQLNSDPLPWLLEFESPGVRYLALRDLEGRSAGDPELLAARKAAHRDGPIAAVLAGMDAGGYWVKPGPGYNPKYTSTVWSLILLAQLGARLEEDERIGKGCHYLLEHNMSPLGQFTCTGAPSGTVDCLQGNLIWSLLEMGCDDPRLVGAVEWMARTVTGEGLAPASERQAERRYYAYKCGPVFACGVNANQACAWGGIKVMLAFANWPAPRRTPMIDRAIQTGVDFLFSKDPALADYPSGTNGKPSQNWWKFGFPVFYITDLLQNVETLVKLGYGDDPCLMNALELIRQKQDERGRWPLEYNYTGKTWADFGSKKEPNKWVTLRALRVLKLAAQSSQVAQVR